MRFREVSLSARLALGLGVLFLVQLVVSWLAGSDAMGDLLALHGSRYAPWEALRLATYALVHDVSDPLHILFNAFGLFWLGSVLEQERGGRAVVASFVLGVVVGGLAYALHSAAIGNEQKLVGASGGVLAVIVAAGVSAPHLTTFLRIPLWALVSIFVGIDLIRFVNSFGGVGGGQVAYGAHLGGALAGLVLGLRGVRGDFAPRWSMPVERVRSALRRRRIRRERRRGEQLDRLLQKIHDEGIDALSASERKVLERASKRLKRGGGDPVAPGERRPTRSGTRDA